MADLDRIIEATPSNGGARILKENHDRGSVNWENGLGDKAEMGNIVAGSATESELIAAANRRHNLASTADGKLSLVYNALKGDPWHELGIGVEGAMSLQDAMNKAQLDYGLELVPSIITIGDRQIETGAFHIIRTDRDDETAILSSKSVTDSYTLIPNRIAFEWMDSIFAEFGLRYDTAGVIGNGEDAWVQAEMPSAGLDLRGDESKAYLLFSANHAGLRPIEGMAVMSRTVCANTKRLNLAAGRGTKSRFVVPHTKNAGFRMESIKREMQASIESFNRFRESAELLASKPAGDVEAHVENLLSIIIDSTVTVGETEYNDPRRALEAVMQVTDAEQRLAAEKRIERLRRKQNKVREELFDRYETDRNGRHETTGGTLWGVYNTASEFADHSGQRNYRGSDRQRTENRAASMLTGSADRLKESALEYVLDYAERN